MAGAASQAGDTWLFPGTWSHLWFAGVRECPPCCSIVGVTETVHQFFCILHVCNTCSLCRVELVVKFPARGSTRVLLCPFPGVLWLYSVGQHPVSSLHIYILCCVAGIHGRVRLAKQETLTPPGHLVSPLVCRGPWMSTVVLYCWCHRYSASVLLYFTSMTYCPLIIQFLWIISVRCIPLNLRSKTRRKSSLLLTTWIYSCQSLGTVNFTLPFTTSVTILISTLQTFHSWAETSHLRPPMALLSHNSSDTPGLAPLKNVLFWGRCDFPISFSDRSMKRNVWDRL